MTGTKACSKTEYLMCLSLNASLGEEYGVGHGALIPKSAYKLGWGSGVFVSRLKVPVMSGLLLFLGPWLSWLQKHYLYDWRRTLRGRNKSWRRQRRIAAFSLGWQEWLCEVAG